MTKSMTNAKKTATLAMLAALAYVVMLVGRVPLVLWLKYDPKDVIIAISGFLFGPLSALSVSVVVSFVEMISASDTGIIGFVMNVLSTCTFVCPAAWLYHRKRSIHQAILGLLVGALLMTLAMVLWNYLITPLYMDQPRADVAAMLIPVFVPFNLLKAGLNTALTLLLYKPVNAALRRTGLLPPVLEQRPAASHRRISVGVTLLALMLFAACVLLALAYKGVI